MSGSDESYNDNDNNIDDLDDVDDAADEAFDDDDDEVDAAAADNDDDDDAYVDDEDDNVAATQQDQQQQQQQQHEEEITESLKKMEKIVNNLIARADSVPFREPGMRKPNQVFVVGQFVGGGVNMDILLLHDFPPHDFDQYE